MALPALTLLDAFERAEKPLSNGGKWAKITALVLIGEDSTGPFGYVPASSFSTGEDAAYWTAAEFLNPGVAFTVNKEIGTTERSVTLYFLENPASSEPTGYCLRMAGTAGTTTCKVLIEKLTKGVRSILSTTTGVKYVVGDRFALQSTGATVIAWYKSGEGAWSVIAEVSSATITKGFVGLGGKGNLTRQIKIEAASAESTHEHTLSTSNSSSPSMHREPARTMSRTQASSPSFIRTVASALTRTQAQSATVARTFAPGSPFVAPQGSSSLLARTVARILVVAQATVKRVSPALVALVVLDTFSKNEKPVPGPWAVVGGTVRAGEVVGEKWLSSDTFAAGENAAYYTTSQFANPVMTIEVGTLELTGAERYYSIYACLQSPASAELSGYRAKLMQTKTGNPVLYTFLIERLVKGVPTVLAEATGLSYANPGGPPAFAFSAQGGVLTIWKLAGGVWEAVLEARDTAWSTGYVGFGSKGNAGRVDNPSAVSTSNATVVETNIRAQTLTARQASSYGPQLPVTAIVDGLEGELSFNEAGDWTILSWAESIGNVRQLNKGLVGKPHPVGWGEGEAKAGGARYNITSPTDPINYIVIRNGAGTVGNYAAIGICVPAAERSGYVARIERVEGHYKVTLERWIAGAKTVLAETTIAENFFAPGETTRASPFALTLVGGVLRLWLAASGAPTVLLSVTDTTFTSGYNTMEVLGANWLLGQERASTMDGNVSLVGTPTNARTLTATQGQAASRGATQIARTLAPSQGSSPTVKRAVTRSFSATQSSAATILRGVGRILGVSQGTAATKQVAISRALSVGQASGAIFVRNVSRTISLQATQVASWARTLAQQLTSTQASAVGMRREVVRDLSAGQGQSASRGASVSRAFVTTASAAATRLIAVARLLGASQGQAAEQEGAVAHRTREHTQEALQGSSAALSRALGRHLTARGAAAIAFGHTPSRVLGASNDSSATLGRALAVELAAGASSSATLGRTQVSVLLAATATSGAVVVREVSRSFTSTQPQAAVLVNEVTKVPLPPPVSMSSSVTRNASTSTAASKPRGASIGGDVLTSSAHTSSMETL